MRLNNKSERGDITFTVRSPLKVQRGILKRSLFYEVLGMILSDKLTTALKPLLDVLPADQAMTQLVVQRGASADQLAAVETVLRDPIIAGNTYLQAGLWLYVDELDRSHSISQGIDDTTGSYWHGIMHRREGDFGNSHYWFNRVGHHPAMDTIDDYDGHRFIDEVEAGANPDRLIAIQRAEWNALFNWCTNQ